MELSQRSLFSPRAHLNEAAHEIVAVMLDQRKHERLVHERRIPIAIQREGLQRVKERGQRGQLDGTRRVAASASDAQR